MPGRHGKTSRQVIDSRQSDRVSILVIISFYLGEQTELDWLSVPKRAVTSESSQAVTIHVIGPRIRQAIWDGVKA